MCCAGHATKGRGWLRWGVGYSAKVGLDERRPRAGQEVAGKREAGPVTAIVYRDPCRSALREKRTLNAPAQSQGPSTGAVKRAGPRRARTGAGVKAGERGGGEEGREGGGVVLRGVVLRGEGMCSLLSPLSSLLSPSLPLHTRVEASDDHQPSYAKTLRPVLHCPEKCVIVCLFGTYSRHQPPVMYQSPSG